MQLTEPVRIELARLTDGAILIVDEDHLLQRVTPRGAFQIFRSQWRDDLGTQDSPPLPFPFDVLVGATVGDPPKASIAARSSG